MALSKTSVIGLCGSRHDRVGGGCSAAWLAVAALAWGVGGLWIGDPRGAIAEERPPEAKREPLVVGVDTDGFLQALDGMRPSRATLSALGVSYDGGRPMRGYTGVCVGVYPTLEAARTAYDEGFARAARTLAPPPPEGIGDQFHCPTPGNGTLWLRRLNVIVQAAWSGGREQAVAFARRVDNTILSNSAVCPRGLRVPVPKIECSVPTRVPLGEVFEVRYGTTDGAMVRAETNSELHSSGSIPVLARELGPLKLTLRFASSMNVMFEKHLEVEVVRAEDLAEPGQPQAWRWPGMALYFLHEPTHKWGSEPDTEREWLEVDQSTFALIREPVEMRHRVVQDLRAVLRPRWLPTPELVEVRDNCARGQREPVYYSVFRTAEYGVVYMGVLGKHLFVYIEQPDPLPAEHELLTAQDVLTETVLPTVESDADARYPRGPLMTRNLRRYRALRPEGPYEPVNILLLEIGSMTPLDLYYPGYR